MSGTATATKDTITGPSPETEELLAYVSGFIDEHIIPDEIALGKDTPESRARMKELQAINKEKGYWAMYLPADGGGMGISFLSFAYVNERLGRSLPAPRAFGSMAPDSGNAELLYQFGTPEQKERWLKPLVAGEIRSTFSMTEPDVSGSDPTGLQTTAVREGDEWVINGRKWFSSNAKKANFLIVMAVTDPDQPPHSRMSQIIVPADTPGFSIERNVEVFGEEDADHPVVRYDNVRVPVTNLLGPQGWGFKLSQKRLGPGRIHHCMRNVGMMQRAFDLMCERALSRSAFGSLLSEKQTIQNWITDSVIDIQTSRLLTMQAAARVDAGDEARAELSMLKYYVPSAGCRVVDRAMQVFGAKGLTNDTPLWQMFKYVRHTRVADGPDEVHSMVVSRAALRSYRDGRGWDFSHFRPA